MRTAKAKLKSLSPLSWSRYYVVDRLDDEDNAAFERRTWNERFHYTQDGHAKIPAMAFKHSLASAAKYLNIKIKGQRNATYTKFFQAGVIVAEDIVLPDKKADIKGEWYFVPSDGKVGGGTRVEKCFPVIYDWEAEVDYLLLEDKITKEVFSQVLEASGMIRGIGRFRPENRGVNGRFEVKGIKWT